MSSLVPPLAYWSQEAGDAAYRTWVDTLPVLAARPRPKFLGDLAALMSFILALAGDEAPRAAKGIYHAIQEGCGWWP